MKIIKQQCNFLTLSLASEVPNEDSHRDVMIYHTPQGRGQRWLRATRGTVVGKI